MEDDSEEWVHVGQAVKMVSSALNDYVAAKNGILRRLQSGEIQSKATAFVNVDSHGNEKRLEDHIIPRSFWASAENLVHQDFWQLGDYKFSRRVHGGFVDDLFFIGVKFFREDVKRLVPTHLTDRVPKPVQPVEKKHSTGGPPFNSQHFFAAAQVALKLGALPAEELAGLKAVAVGDMLIPEYEGSKHSPPSDSNRERAGAAILRAVKRDR